MIDVAPHSDAPALEGRLIAGKYRVGRLIGSGGMGTVWEGVHETLGTRVAIKFIKPQFASQPEARARFEIEARAAAKLKTKHAVHVYDYGVTPEGLPYIVMEFLDGESLSDAIIERGPLPATEVAHHHRPGVARAGEGARGRHRPPRPQAGQHLPRQDQRREHRHPAVPR